MPQAPFEHFFKMADNQHIFRQKSAISFSTGHMSLWNSVLFYIIRMLDINKVHLSLIEISVVQ